MIKQKKPIVIGITGYPGTGKSTLAKLFRLIKCPVQEADQVVHELFQKPEVINQIIEVFPQAVTGTQINKERLASIVFEDSQKLKQLEVMLHSLVYKEHQKFIQLYLHQSLVVLEIPLLFETGREKICDVVLYTICQPEIAHERVKKRGWSEKRYQATLKRLLPDIEKQKQAQFIIDTSLSKVNTWQQLKSALQEICNRENLNA
jgi:dephospho-CoA kinase